MKIKGLFFLVFILVCCQISVAQIKSQVSECFELVSITFRLADAPEYVNNQNPDYVKDIDCYFAENKQHDLIHYLRDLRKEFGVSFDAVAVAAAYLDIENEQVVVRSDADVTQVSKSDSRWSERTFRSFVALLNDFYRDTKFGEFYIRHSDRYHAAIIRMDKLLEDVNWEWFRKNLGESYKKNRIVVSLVNGTSNYGFSIVGKDYQMENGIVVGCSAGIDGFPHFQKGMLMIIAHELLHGYGNAQIDAYWDQLASSATKIFAYVKDEMEKKHYGDVKSMMYEWFTNLLTIMYCKDNSLVGFSTDLQIRYLQEAGFIWMERSVEFMKHLGRNRYTRSITLHDYMSQVVGFINYTAEHFEDVVGEFRNRHPYIVEFFPASNSTVLTSDMETIEIRFSEPMATGIHGISYIEDEKVELLPYVIPPSWKDEYTFQIRIDKGKVEKGKVYGFKLDRKAFQSRKANPMKNDCEYILKTME